jgi:hypothetical protein
MSEFASPYAYWDFARSVRDHWRWIHEDGAAAFLASVRKASHSRKYILRSGCQLWRCQRGSISKEQGEYPKTEKEMVLNPQVVRGGGRANPPGFAYLYLATDPQTAMAEMRPWVGESLSAALFEVQQAVPVVLCQSQNEDPLGRVSLEIVRSLRQKRWRAASGATSVLRSLAQ